MPDISTSHFPGPLDYGPITAMPILVDPHACGTGKESGAMATIEVRGELFNVTFDGPARAPVLLLSNSVGTSLRMWSAQMPVLQQHFRVLRYDVRGHHLASRAEGEFSIAQLAGDALGLLDQMGVDAAHWCGVSMGGVIGRWIMVNEPARLKRVVLANTAAWLGPPSKWQSRIEAVNAGGTAAIADASVERWFTSRFRAAEPDTAQCIKAQLLATPTKAYAGCAAALRDIDLRDEIVAIRHPVLIIGATYDQATPMIDSYELARKIEDAKLIELDAAHLSNIEQADAFNAAVVDFLMTP